MPGKRRKKPLAPRAGNPSQNSRIKAATQAQSEVTPEDYPLEQRGAMGLTPPDEQGGDTSRPKTGH